MSNHVHILVIPDRPDALARTFRNAHGRFAQYANAEHCRSGHFWQNRYYSCPVEECAAAKVLAYIECNPVRAGIAVAPGDYPHSSAAVHLGRSHDRMAILDLAWWHSRWTPHEWSMVLNTGTVDPAELRRATFTGRPLGSATFISTLEQQLGRRLSPQRGGRPKRQQAGA